MRTLSKCTAILVVLLASSPAAEAGPFYVGGSLGDGANLDASDFDVNLGGLEADTDDRTWKVFAGLGIGRIFGVEAAWHDFGTVSCCDLLSDGGFVVDVEGISAAVVAGIPLSRLRLFAKLGVFSWDVDGDAFTIAGPVPFSLDGEDAMGGVGADLKVTRHFSVRAELEVFEIAGGGLDIVSVGVQYRF